MRSAVGLIFVFLLILASCEAPTPTNEPPSPPSNPNPPDGAVVTSPVTFGWVSSDPDGDPLAYDLYLGEGTPVLYVSDLTENVYGPVELEPGTYFWKVVVSDGTHEVEGPVWSFTVVEGGEIEISNPRPADDAVDVPIFDVMLSWDGPDATYTVYLSRSEMLVEMRSDYARLVTIRGTSIELPIVLDFNTTYYWTVVSEGVSGGIWSFKTVENPNGDEFFIVNDLSIGRVRPFLMKFSTDEGFESISELRLSGSSVFVRGMDVVGEELYLVYVENYEGAVAVFDISDPENPTLESTHTLNGYLNDVWYVHYIGNNKILVDDTNGARVYDLETGEKVWEKRYANAVVQDQNMFVTYWESGNRLMTVYNVSEGEPVTISTLRLVVPFQYDYGDYRVIPFGDHVYSLGNEPIELNVISLESGTVVKTVEIGDGSIEGYAFNRGELALSLDDGTVLVYDVSNPTSPELMGSVEGSGVYFVKSDKVVLKWKRGGLNEFVIYDFEDDQIVWRGVKIFDGMDYIDAQVLNGDEWIVVKFGGWENEIFKFDVSDPHSPRLMASVEAPRLTNYDAKKVFVDGGKLVIYVESTGGSYEFLSYDLETLTLESTVEGYCGAYSWKDPVEKEGYIYLNCSTLDDPFILNVFDLDLNIVATHTAAAMGIPGEYHNTYSMAVGEHLYVSVGIPHETTTDYEVIALNLNDPENPFLEKTTVVDRTLTGMKVFEGKLFARYYEDPYYNVLGFLDLNTGTFNELGITSVHDFVVEGDILYVVTRNSLGIYDISNPSNPIEMYGVSSTGMFERLSKSGDLLFISPLSNERLSIIDVSNPEDPEFLFVNMFVAPYTNAMIDD